MYPILFEFGFITVYALWFFIALGFVVASLVFVNVVKRSRLKLDVLADNSFVLFFWTLAIARLTFIAFHFDIFFYQFHIKNLTHVFEIWDKGLSFWGALAGWISGIWYLTRGDRVLRLRLLDCMAPALLAGIFLGNIGAFFDGINYGSPTKMPWGIIFRSANVKYITAIHPTQLYGVLYAGLIAVGAYLLLKKLRGAVPGFVTEFSLSAFCSFKFLEEFFRGDEALSIGFVRFPQLVAFIGIIASGYLLYQRYTNKSGGDPQHVLSDYAHHFFTTLKSQGISEKKNLVQSEVV